MDRKQKIVRTGYVGILVNIVIASVKAVVGVISGSMAFVVEAMNNITDAVSSVLTVIAARLAGRPADDKHPFGYGRIEYFAAIIISVLIIVTGVSSFVESVKGIIHPATQEYSTVGIVLVAVALVIKLGLGLYTRKQGKSLHSDALRASASECLMDCILSVATIASAIITVTTGVSLDSWLAAILSLLIVKVGVEMLLSPVNDLLGRRNDQTLVKDLKARVKTIEGVLGVYDVVLHDYGPEYKIGSLHVEVGESMSASDMHHLTRAVQTLVRHEFGFFVTVGFYAHNAEGTPEAEAEKAVREHVTALDGVLGMHGFYMDPDLKVLSMDIVYSFKMKKPSELRAEVCGWLEKSYPGYECLVGMDINYSE